MGIMTKICDWLCWDNSVLGKIILLTLFIITVFLLICFPFTFTSGKPIPEEIEILAEGQLISIRATGAWNIYDTELKFDDGSMLLMTYSFCRSNQLRIGKSYKIWHSSIYGYCCGEIDGEEDD